MVRLPKAVPTPGRYRNSPLVASSQRHPRRCSTTSERRSSSSRAEQRLAWRLPRHRWRSPRRRRSGTSHRGGPNAGDAPRGADGLPPPHRRRPVDPKEQLVHNDFRSANVLHDGTGITAVLDFEEVAYRSRLRTWPRRRFCSGLATTTGARRANPSGKRSWRHITTKPR